MRKIKFDEATIQQIRTYIEDGHTLDETCNRFTLKYDTLRRVMYENGIEAYFKSKRNKVVRNVSDADVNLICNLYAYTDTRIADIVTTVKLPNYVVQDILTANFTQQFRANRKAKLYRKSKLGELNPMSGKFKELHPNYKRLVDDGNGYHMILKPDWYTGRKGSEYVFYHSVVVAEALGISEIPQGFVVHHIDGNKQNNDISNLALVSVSGHGKWHSMLNKLCKVQRLSGSE